MQTLGQKKPAPVVVPLLSTVEPTVRQKRTALLLIGLSCLVFLSFAPFARVPLPPTPAFLPIYQSAYLVVSLVTAMLLLGQFPMERSRALLVLAGGYLFDALMALAHMLSFPGLFRPAGLLGSGPQTTAWLYFFWHGGFPLFVIGYALARRRPGDVIPTGQGQRTAAAIVVSVFAVAGALLFVATRDVLPAIMQGDTDLPAKLVVALVTWGVTVAALVTLRPLRVGSLIDLWLAAVMVVWIFDIALSAVFNHARYDLGWYVGRAYGVAGGSVLLVVLLLESNALYARLARLRSEEWRAASERLTESEAQYRVTFDQAALGIAEVSLDGRWLRVNRKLCEMLGYDHAELTSKTVAEVTHPEDIASHDTDREQMRGGDVRTRAREKRYLHKDGHIVWARGTGTTVPKADGTPDHFIVVIEDITERRQADQELRDLRNEMERMTRAQVAGQTVAALAHELNQPLNAVATFSAAALKMLSSHHHDPARLRYALESTAQQAQRAGRVVRDLVGFLNQGRIRTEALDLNDLIRSTCEQIRRHAVGAVRLDLALVPSLRRVLANAMQVEKVLGNLVDNAIEAMRVGGVADAAIAVTVRTGDNGATAQVTVSDNGPGIDLAIVHRIFDPFFTTKPHGLGMGLAISRAIVEAQGGQLWVEVQAGTGAVFHFTLPFADDQQGTADESETEKDIQA